MRLVPRQLQIHGLTGDVPYFGGRLTPAQAYAASHPRPPETGGRPSSTPPVPIPGIPSAVPQASPLNLPSTMQPRQVPSVLAPATAQPVPQSRPGSAPTRPGAPEGPESQRAIQQLLLAGIITSAEADQLAGRLV